jgi:hypothetical protein
VREGQAGGDGDGDGLQDAVFLAAAAAVAAGGGGRDGLPRQFRQLVVQAGLVALDDQDVVRFLAGDQEIAGMIWLVSWVRVPGDGRSRR